MTVARFVRTLPKLNIPQDDRLTHRQREFLTYIAAYQKKYGISPTFREISIAMGVTSKGTVSVMVRKLIHKGLLRHNERTVRGLSVE